MNEPTIISSTEPPYGVLLAAHKPRHRLLPQRRGRDLGGQPLAVYARWESDDDRRGVHGARAAKRSARRLMRDHDLALPGLAVLVIVDALLWLGVL
jgi:hypothetical protein